MANGHGGARKGAGRKSKEEKNAEAIERVENQIRPKLRTIVEKQIQIAIGGYQEIIETWEPAGLVTVKTTAFDASGKAVIEEVLAYPDKDPSELVLVRRVTKPVMADTKAAQYLINRIMGAPSQRIKFEKMTDAELIAYLTGEATGTSGS